MCVFGTYDRLVTSTSTTGCDIDCLSGDSEPFEDFSGSFIERIESNVRHEPVTMTIT